MIADYMYNTPALAAGSSGVMLLLKQPFTNRTAFNAAVLGKSLAELSALTSVIGTAAADIKRFGFMMLRNPTGAYAGHTATPNFVLPDAADFDITSDGRATAFVLAVMQGGVCVRAVTMSIPAEVKATRTAFSVDDNFVSAIEGPLGIGYMVGKMSKALSDWAPDSAPSVIALSMSNALSDVAPESGPTVMSAPLGTTLRDLTHQLTPTEFSPVMLRTLMDVAPTSL